MKIIGRQGKNRYLVAYDDTPYGEAFVADVKARVRYRTRSAQTIIARGYWDEVEDDPDLLDKIRTYKMASNG